MAGDAFLQIAGLSGESTDEDHSNWIDITSFSFSISNTEDALKKTDEEGEGPNISSISISKKLDKTSPKLASAACSGSLYGSAAIELCRSANGQNKFMQYKLKNVSIENYSVSGGNDYPTESIELRFTSIEWTFADGNITGNWDITENKGS